MNSRERNADMEQEENSVTKSEVEKEANMNVQFTLFGLSVGRLPFGCRVFGRTVIGC